MFNRRFIREKVVQAYYGFRQGGVEDALVCRQNMLAGLEQTAELYYWQLSFLVDLSDYAREQYEQAAERGRRSREDLDGIRMMAYNKAVDKLRADANLQLSAPRYSDREKQAYTDLVKTVYETLFLNTGAGSVATRVQDAVAAKAKDGVSDSQVLDEFARDREFLRKIYKKKIAEHPALRSFCESRSIYWEADYESVCFWVGKTTLANLTPDAETVVDKGWSVDDEAVVFAAQLLDKTLLHGEEYDEHISRNSENWRADRIGATEKALMDVAVSEMINFPSIAIKVTLNEYIELSKYFCTRESAAFINGVLHKTAEDLKAKKLIRKTGRGLI